MFFSSDLRWNNVGLLGGRALLNALDYNKTLVKLELAGNTTPNDILRAIGKCQKEELFHSGSSMLDSYVLFLKDHSHKRLPLMYSGTSQLRPPVGLP